MGKEEGVKGGEGEEEGRFRGGRFGVQEFEV